MHSTKFGIITLIVFNLLLIQLPSQAQSTKFVQWWDEFHPRKDDPVSIGNAWYRSQRSPYDLQGQDLDGDGVANDSLVWYPFSITEQLNPVPPSEGGKSWQTYRIDLPSAEFFGGLLARFTNVSDILNPRDERFPLFNRFQQATVQRDGARPCCYTDKMPNNVCRFLFPGNIIHLFDMTVMVINEGGDCCPVSQAFLDREEAEVNFTSIFLWKKSGFINGGSEVDKVTFDETSRIMVDITRFRKNIEEMRFLVLEGETLWMSEFSAPIKDPETISLNPLESRWAHYNPTQADPETVAALLKKMDRRQELTADEQALLVEEVNRMDFDADQAEFVEHTFTDVQGAGVYFATYTFSHQPTQLVFDNFQLFAAGDVPPMPSIAVGLDEQIQVLTNDQVPQAGFEGGIAVNDEAYERTVRQCVIDDISIRGKIIVPPEHVGKAADIIIVAAYKPRRKSPETETVYYVLDSTGAALTWNGDLTGLSAFQPDVELGEEQVVEILEGKLDLPGYVRLYFGYLLKEENILVYSPRNLEMKIYDEYTLEQ